MTIGLPKTLSSGKLAAYASLGFITKALTLPLISYLPPAFAQATGLSLATLGIVFMVARLWDIVMDPVAGYLIDRFDPPLGPRKFWLLVALPLMLGTIPPLFAPGIFGLEGQFGLIMIIGLLFVFYFGWTLLSVGQYAWPVDLSPDFKSRTRLIGWRESAGVLGMISILLTPTLMEHGSGATLDRQVIVMGIFAFIMLPICIIWAVSALPAAVRDRKRSADIFSFFRLVSRDGELRGVLLADLLSGAGFAVNSATSFFIFSDILGLGARFSVLMFAFFAGMVAGAPAMMLMSVRMGARRCFLLAMTGAALSVLSLGMVSHGILFPVLFIQFVFGFCTGGYQINLNSLMTRVATTDRLRKGVDASGAHFALLALTNKLGYAFAIGVAYPALQLMGFQAGQPITPETKMAVLSIGLGLTAFLLAAAGLVAWTGRKQGVTMLDAG
jgi:Na+/melibiose symporter-like transporter